MLYNIYNIWEPQGYIWLPDNTVYYLNIDGQASYACALLLQHSSKGGNDRSLGWFFNALQVIMEPLILADDSIVMIDHSFLFMANVPPEKQNPTCQLRLPWEFLCFIGTCNSISGKHIQLPSCYLPEQK